MAKSVARGKKISSGAMLGIVIVILLIVFGGIYYYQMSSPSDSDTVQSNEQAQIVATNNITILDYTFLPKVLTIKAGEAVEWTNRDVASHSIVSDSGEDLNSPLLKKGETYYHLFSTAGTYEYHCSAHPSMMKAKIIVQ